MRDVAGGGRIGSFFLTLLGYARKYANYLTIGLENGRLPAFILNCRPICSYKIIFFAIWVKWLMCKMVSVISYRQKIIDFWQRLLNNWELNLNNNGQGLYKTQTLTGHAVARTYFLLLCFIETWSFKYIGLYFFTFVPFWVTFLLEACLPWW